MMPSRTPRLTAWWRLGLLAIALAIACPRPAPAAPEMIPGADKPRPDAPAVHVDPLNRRTPRDAMAGFLDATRHRDYARAAEFLDLRRLPAADRAVEGRVLARQLRVVLDQALAPDPETLSDEEDGSRRGNYPPDRELVGTIKGETDSAAIVLQRVAGDGDTRLWKVSTATVAQIPRLYREFGYGPLGEYLPPMFMVAANPRVRFIELGESSLDLEIFAYVPTANYDEFLAVREDIYLRIMDIVAASGTRLALPSQTTYTSTDSGPDDAKRAAAEARVREWRETGKLFMPDVPPETASALDGTLRYPPAGSATANA